MDLIHKNIPTISRNTKEYPQFDWVEVEKYRIEQ